uniref:Uncharacterized protein n=1 Tax=Arundo donax TaxID=35708 RepID=A0A0A9FVV0_ARUDO
MVKYAMVWPEEGSYYLLLSHGKSIRTTALWGIWWGTSNISCRMVSQA